MKRTIVGVGAVLAAGVLLAACGSGDASTDAAGEVSDSSVRAVEVEADPSPTGDADGGSADPLVVLEAAGAACAPAEDPGESDCTLDGIEFRYAESGWEDHRNDRRAACDLGYVNDEYTVLTDGQWAVYVDYNEQNDQFREILAEQGVESEVVLYCG